MNPKFVHNLKLFCKIRKENYEVWKRAYQMMPPEVQIRFKADIAKFAKFHRYNLTN